MIDTDIAKAVHNWRTQDLSNEKEKCIHQIEIQGEEIIESR